MERSDRADVNRAMGQTDGTDRATAYPDEGSGFQPRTGTHDVRRRIIEYVAPYTNIFPLTYALVFGTRHGVGVFADDIVRLYHDGYFKKLMISGGVRTRNQRQL